MRTKLLAAVSAACLLLPAMAHATDNVAVTPGSGKTLGCKDVAGVCYSQHAPVDSSGADTSDATLHTAKTSQPAPITAGFLNTSAQLTLSSTTTAITVTTTPIQLCN